MTFSKLQASVSHHFRSKRFEQLKRFAQFEPGLTVLDVGGQPDFWRNNLPAGVRLTVLNIKTEPDWAQWLSLCSIIQADGAALPFQHKTFDLVVSNAVIEHLGSYQRQEAFARELRRVGRKLWIQTPARWFPVDSHFLTPFFHYLPKSFQLRMLRHFTLWGFLEKPSAQQVKAVLDEIRLLRLGEMRALFPDCDIQYENFMGMAKSYIVCRP